MKKNIINILLIIALCVALLVSQCLYAQPSRVKKGREFANARLGSEFANAQQTRDYKAQRDMNLWNLSQNVCGIYFTHQDIHYAELYSNYESGEFRQTFEAPTQWSVGAIAEAIATMENLSLSGTFSFENITGYNVSGCMSGRPHYYPVSVYEFTPGMTTRQNYQVKGGLSYKLSSNWHLGAKVDYNASNYTKRKDLRHTNYLLNLGFAPSAMYTSPVFNFGFTYKFNKNSESIDAEELGISSEPYYTFFDKGNFYGNKGVWTSASSHLKEAGVSGFPSSEFINGVEIQSEFYNFFISFAFDYAKGRSGEKDTFWYDFNSNHIDFMLSYRLRKMSSIWDFILDFDWKRQHTFENILEKQTVEGVTTNVKYGSVGIFDREMLELSPKLRLYTKSIDGEFGAIYSRKSHLSYITYPEANLNNLHCLNLYAKAVFRTGKFDFPVMLSVADGAIREEKIKYEEIEVSENTDQLIDFYNFRNDYETALKINASLGIKYRFSKPRGLYVGVKANLLYGAKLHFMDKHLRYGANLNFGYEF